MICVVQYGLNGVVSCFDTTPTGLVLHVKIHWAMLRSGMRASPSSSIFSTGILALAFLSGISHHSSPMSLDLLTHTVRVAEFWNPSLFQEIRTNTIGEVIGVLKYIALVTPSFSFTSVEIGTCKICWKLGHMSSSKEISSWNGIWWKLWHVLIRVAILLKGRLGELLSIL